MSSSDELCPGTRIRSLAKASGQLSQLEQRDVEKVADVTKDVMRSAARMMISDADRRPCARSTSSDGTPIVVSHRIRAELPGGRIIERSGKTCHEFQVGMSFYKCIDPSVQPKVVFCDPMPMTHGKTAAAEWAIMQHNNKSLRDMGHTGPAVEHYAWDRAKFGALARMAKAHHNKEQFEASEGVSAWELKKTQFVVCTPCACHDTNKAQEWGMLAEFKDRELLRDVFVSIASLRNSWQAITSHLAGWIAKCIVYKPPLSNRNIEQLRILYDAVGVDPDVSDTLANVLQLRFKDGQLHVSAACSDMEGVDVVGTVHAALLACWKIQRFTESRWHTVGTSARGVVIGLLTGLSGLVDFILAQKEGKTPFLHGWYRLKEDRLTFLICCAMVSRISDSIMADLLADGRVLRNIASMQEGLAEEMEWLATVPSFVFEMLSRQCPLNPTELRSKCLGAAQVNLAFIEDRIFSATRRDPFRWAIGSEAELSNKLEELRASPKPHEQVTLQIWELLQYGYSKNRLLGVLQLIQDLEWSTLCAEQFHASAASLSRFHPEYGCATLISRALVVSTNRLLPSKSDTEKELDKYRRALGKLVMRQPQNIGADKLFLRDLMSLAKKKYGVGSGRPAGLTHTIIRGNAHRYKQQSEAVKRSYETATIAHIAEKGEERAQEVEQVEGKIALAEERLATEPAGSGSIRFSDCAWGPREFELFKTYYDLKDYSGVALRSRRAQALLAPEPLPVTTLVDLVEYAVWEPDDPENPHWVKQLAHGRDFFNGCALKVGAVDGEERYFLFVYARQSPIRVYLSKLDAIEITAPPPPSCGAAWAHRFAQAQPRHRFQWHPLHNVLAVTLGELSIADTWVIVDLAFSDGYILETCCEPQPLSEYLDSIPIKERAERGQASGSGGRSKSATQHSHKDELVAEFPWLEDLWKVDKPAGLGYEPEGGKRKKRKMEHTDDDEVELDREFDVLLDELLRYRAELASDRWSSESVMSFATTALGGAWTMKHKGVEADAVRGYARVKAAIKFCDDRDIPKSYRADIELFEFEHACIFCRAWAHKMQYFFNIAVEAGDHRCVFTPADVDAYTEPTEFTRSAAFYAGHPHIAGRAAVIRRLLI